jgi:hypothetical protein
MSAWRIRILVFSVVGVFLWAPPVARAAGVTVITHGLNGNADGWVTGMANRIPYYHSFPGTSYAFYKLHFYYSGGFYYLTWTRLGGTQPSLTDSSEIVVALDWSQLADGNSYNTYQIASAVVPALLSTNFISELNGHALAELPIHLIGHSRGGSLACEMSRQLGTNGVWVDHVTTLDPHPLNDPVFPLDALLYSAVDAPAQTYLNVLFADNYWQDVALLVYGKSVYGAYVRELFNVSGGYQNIGDSYYPHSNVHLWYHATVDERVPADDSEALVTGTEFANWYTSYEDWGIEAGFKWSLIGRGDRTSSDLPQGFGYPAIRDGYNQAWDLGAGQTGNRVSLPSNNGNWPNVVKVNVIGTNQVPQGTNIAVKFFYQWARPSTSSGTITFYIDEDFNPYNSNSRSLQTISFVGNGSNFMNSQTLNIPLMASNAPLGNYVFYAQISGGGRMRYLYAPEIVTVLPPPDLVKPTVSITNPPSARTYTNSQTVTVSATASDNVGITRVEFYDGSTLRGTDTSAAFTYDWSFTVADNGVHSWTARAYDAAGNVSTSSAVALTVSIDLTLPVVAFTTPTNGQSVTTTPFTVSGTASDPGSPSTGINLVQVRVNGGSWSNATGTTSWTRSVALSACPNTIEARSRDGAGNYSLIASNFITYIPPNIVPNRPTNTAPPNLSSNVTVTPTLIATPFSDPDCVGDAHAASQWQVLNSLGTIVVADSGTDTVNKVSWTVPTNRLFFGSNYQWRVRYRDSRNAWSSNSTPTSFSTLMPLLSGTKQGTNIVLKWPTNAQGFSLQWSTNLGTANWSNATPAPAIVSGQYTVTNNMTNNFRFYRLRR